jgi:hypothetical protein
MKRIFFLAAISLITLLSYSQETVIWNPYVDLDGDNTNYPGKWSIYYDQFNTKHIPDSLTSYKIQSWEFGRERDLMGRDFSLTVWSVGLTDTVKFDIGGSNFKEGNNRSGRRMGFSGYPSDSLPYTWIAVDHLKTNQRYDKPYDSVMVDSNYFHTFIGGKWKHEDISIILSEISDTTGVIHFDFVFTK